MANTQITAAQSRDYNIKQFLITSNSGAKKKDITTLISDLYYYESLLSPSIKLDILYGEIGKTVESEGSYKSLIEGMPLVGTEEARIKLTDPNNVELDLTLFVDNIKPLSQDSKRTIVSVRFVSREMFYNYKTVLNTRFDGKISDHVKKILTDQNILATNKKMDIEETENNYNFIGNNRRPFYSILWLARKSIPKTASAKGNTAGFFFYETSDGFKFKSIDGLLSKNDPSGGEKKYKSFIYNDTSDSRGTTIPPQYDGKILEQNLDTATGDVQKKLEIGTYSTRTILFDPFNGYYQVINPTSARTESKLQKAGDKFPEYNRNLRRDSEFTRTQYMLIDKGSLPSGDTKEQIKKSESENFDPKNILNQSVMRYNQFFSSQMTVTITADFSLHVGDLFFIDYPELSDKDTKDMNKQFGGFYVISELCHYISITDGGYTKLTLVRDSVGKKGTPKYNAI